MIRYSNQPSKESNAITDSPTSPIKTKSPGSEGQLFFDLEDLDANDNNEG